MTVKSHPLRAHSRSSESRPLSAPSWYFKSMTPGDTVRQSTAGDSFDGAEVSGPSVAVIREGIQNSMDATIDAAGSTLVRIRLLEGPEAPEFGEVAAYLHEVLPHYESAELSCPRPETRCRCLVFEDFDATGLTGDPGEPFVPEGGERNDFHSFFWAEGITQKASGQRGSRGVGKATFWLASRVRTIFALTRRSDNRRLLMGRACLPYHLVGTVPYRDDGHFGLPDPDRSGFVLPLEDETYLDQFRHTFRLFREGETGVSIVVPFLEEDVKEAGILDSIVRNYFYPILSKRLSVIFGSTEVNETEIDHSSLVDFVGRRSDLTELVPFVELAHWACAGASAQGRFTIQAAGKPIWRDELLSDEIRDRIRSELDGGRPVAVRVHVRVHPKRGASQQSHFDVYMQRSAGQQSSVPHFFRNDLLISSVRQRSRGLRGVTALVVVEDDALAGFLRESENISHTDWQSKKVASTYKYAADCIRFVAQAPRRILDLAEGGDTRRDKVILSDFFPQRTPRKRVVHDVPDTPSTRPFTFWKVAGGFSIGLADESVVRGANVVVEVAYDVRRGSALGKYAGVDFRLTEPPIVYDCAGATVLSVRDNRLELKVTDPKDFRVKVRGFDEERQLYIRATELPGETE